MFCNNDRMISRKAAVENHRQYFIDIALPIRRVHENIIKGPALKRLQRSPYISRYDLYLIFYMALLRIFADDAARCLVDKDRRRCIPAERLKPHRACPGENIKDIRLNEPYIGKYIENAFPYPSQRRSRRISSYGCQKVRAFGFSTNNFHICFLIVISAGNLLITLIVIIA